ncbi:MAG: hypothetical protein O7E57_17915 [Gammaproteobacteria bacterium]|nr:hypothetical protein [Gammaproteobacteria bacterium]
MNFSQNATPADVPEDRWLESRPGGGNEGRVLDEAHVTSWRERGFAFVAELFPGGLLDQLETAARKRLPEAGTPEAREFSNFGGPIHFPSAIPALNAISVYPRLLSAAAELLDVVLSNLRLTQSVPGTGVHQWFSTVHVGWAWSAYRRDKMLERLIAAASLGQRAVLGFPQPGSSCWSQGTIAAVAARHGVFGMDMTPYREVLSRGESRDDIPPE